MTRFWLALSLILTLPGALFAQTSSVDADDLRLTVSVIEKGEPPLTQEMIMILIRGVYKRHITREKLEQPDFAGFNWSQLGQDTWRDERVNGQKVKVLERRMAIYPERAGTLEIGAFTHHLTLTDEGDDWFDHDITSEPITVEIAAAPVQPGQGWWFPVKRLQISDQWSNPPDQLKPGQGVLRVVRLSALGATPEMIPPMPELTSPSGMIFAHPEKRVTELTPLGPMTHAFWRWTIQPGNDFSTIVEPMQVTYFDTQARVMREVTITAQRVAFDAVALPPVAAPVRSVVLPGWGAFVVGAVVFSIGVGALIAQQRGGGTLGWRRLSMFDGLKWQLRNAARLGQVARTRRAAAALLRRDGASPERSALLHGLDARIFGADEKPAELVAFARQFLKSGAKPDARR